MTKAIKRKRLMKMKNGRHRVATAIEHAYITLSQETMHKLVLEKQLYLENLRKADKTIAELEKERSIFDAIADRMAEHFGKEARPVMEALIRNSQRRGTPFAIFGSRIDAMGMKPLRIHRGIIPEIVYAFSEEIER